MGQACCIGFTSPLVFEFVVDWSRVSTRKVCVKPIQQAFKFFHGLSIGSDISIKSFSAVGEKLNDGILVPVFHLH